MVGRLKLPELELVADPDGFIRDVSVDLGVLGVFELADFPLTEEDKKEIQTAFGRIILRFASSILEEQGEKVLADQLWPED